MKIFDTHTHDYFSHFDEDRDKVMTDDTSSGVQYKVQIGCDEETSKKALALASQYDFCFATAGLHPCNVCEPSKNNVFFPAHTSELFHFFEKMIQENPKKIVGVGETGFDFYHHDFPELRIFQAESFLQHCLLAKKYNKTSIIHTRNARNETLDFLQKNASDLPKKAIVHCFSEDFLFAEEVTNAYGFMLGIGGVVTYKKSEIIQDAVKKTPLHFLLTETDSPYLSPQSVRGKRNQSKNIQEVILCIAELKNIDPEYCADALFDNALRVFF